MEPSAPGLTAGQRIKNLPPGKFLKLGRVIGGGTLEARKLASGATQFYWRRTTNHKTDRMPIGPYSPSAPPSSLAKRETDGGYSVLAAMREAERMASQHLDAIDDGGLRAVKAATKSAKEKAAEQTLDRLLTAYCDHLKALGRTSHLNARSIFNLHVREAWPAKARLPASRITSEDVADMMRRLIEGGHARTANKLRSYMRAAYETARAARTKASIPLHFKDFNVSANPAADTQVDETGNRADKNPLSRDELRTYWRAIKGLEGVRGAALRLHLLTGGQRIEQLVKLETSAIEPDRITIMDGKGRPGRPPRAHPLPLTKLAAAALAQCEPTGRYALSTDGGETHIAGTTLSAWAVAAAGDAIPGFQAKRIRSGVETLLASLGVSQEMRGRLQSHGVSGVQARHYDAHDYLPEKRAALAALEKALLAR